MLGGIVESTISWISRFDIWRVSYILDWCCWNLWGAVPYSFWYWHYRCFSNCASCVARVVGGLRLLILGLHMHMHLPISNISCCSCIRWLQLPLQIFLCLLMMLRWVRVYLVSMVLTTFIFFVSMVILISEYIWLYLLFLNFHITTTQLFLWVGWTST